MKKNVVFWTAIINPEQSNKYGGFEWFEYSKSSWKYWCNKNGVIFYEYHKPTEPDLMAHRVTWQRWWDVFDFLERDNIAYDKIFMVDASTIIRWDTPNIFNLCDNRFVAWRTTDNLAWNYESVKGWNEFFKYDNFDLMKYINAGIVIINESHKEFFKDFKKLYYDNYKKLMEIQKSVKKATDQTALSIYLQMKNVDVNLDIPICYIVTHIHRKEMFNYNWQLNEDHTPFFIKYAYIWVFNGIEKNQRTNIMKQVWEYVKHNYT